MNQCTREGQTVEHSAVVACDLLTSTAVKTNWLLYS